jgi:hypothetical protein
MLWVLRGPDMDEWAEICFCRSRLPQAGQAGLSEDLISRISMV